ncbi:MAG: ATP-binding cassette domain-containing protein, partial [Rhodospirillales bacterium]|nr:ATP-binding cassette domain-containing protein [Rhodospirillales bacterium]
MTGVEDIVVAESLGKSFDDVVAVDSVDFRVSRSSVTGLLGGNGAGKTTTLSMLLGLLLPSAGSVTVFGQDMATSRHSVLHRMNFSSPYVDLPHRLSVRENLTVYGHLYGVQGVRRRVDEIAADLDVVDLLDRRTGSLSAGQKTRVALAKALLNHPELLILDEPTASLDPDTGDWVR